ncbi:protein MOR1-like [Humulus lupulus]|uniref:protein MOR1-like n=1 Tax=Humulus lupulus TaxID=3486 RepID=UPI002B40F80B|nr:protein MOR1-like [Humulus lupulus]
MQIVARLTAERDGEIRKAALNTLATGYKILGEDIWRYVRKLTDAQKSMLDDRFKWKVREMEKRKEGKPGEARAALRRSVREIGLDVAEQSGEVTRSVSGPVLPRKTMGMLTYMWRDNLCPVFLLVPMAPLIGMKLWILFLLVLLSSLLKE